MLPPDIKKRAGRPEKAKRREPEESKNPCRFGRARIKMTCRACGKVGHNKRGCKNKGYGVSWSSGVVHAEQGRSTATHVADSTMPPGAVSFLKFNSIG